MCNGRTLLALASAQSDALELKDPNTGDTLRFDNVTEQNAAEISLWGLVSIRYALYYSLYQLTTLNSNCRKWQHGPLGRGCSG